MLFIANAPGLLCRKPSLLCLLSLRVYCGISNHVQYKLIPYPYWIIEVPPITAHVYVCLGQNVLWNILCTSTKMCQKFQHFYRPVYGLIFLFKWLPGDHNNQGSLVMDSRRMEIFFAKQVMIMSSSLCHIMWSQVITNACATQAILSILLNCEHSDFKLGKTLSDLKEFSSTLPPEVQWFQWFSGSHRTLQMKGQVLTNADVLRKVHNSFARYVCLNSMFDTGYVYLSIGMGQYSIISWKGNIQPDNTVIGGI